MILDKVKLRISVDSGAVNTGTKQPRKWLIDKITPMLKDFIDTGKPIKIMFHVEKGGKIYREYFKLN